MCVPFLDECRPSNSGRENVLVEWRELDRIVTEWLDIMTEQLEALLMKTTLLRQDIYKCLLRLQNNDIVDDHENDQDNKNGDDDRNEDNKKDNHKYSNSKNKSFPDEMCRQCLDMFFSDNFIQEVMDLSRYRRRSSAVVVKRVSMEIDVILTQWLSDRSKEMREQVKNITKYNEIVNQTLDEMKDKQLISNQEYIAIKRDSDLFNFFYCL